MESAIAAIAAQVSEVAKIATAASKPSKPPKETQQEITTPAPAKKPVQPVPIKEVPIQDMDIETCLDVPEPQKNGAAQSRHETQQVPSASAHYHVNNPWPASVFAHTTPSLDLFQGSLPTSTVDITGNQALDDRVTQILTTATHQLAKGGKKPLFAHNYVFRGPELKPTTLNSLSLAEYGWAITRMFKDPAVPDSIKPRLLTHLEELLEDAELYDWEKAVRRWSEQVFALIAQNRLEKGWEDYARIQMLQLFLSKVATARKSLHSQKEPPVKDSAPKDPYPKPRAFTPAHHVDFLKGGPPCRAFNSAQGCSLPSGHSVNGKHLVHVCTYCLYNNSASNPHSDAECRNKYRSAYGYNQ